MTQKQIDSLSLLQRVQAPTPGFFRKLRNIGLMLTAISGAFLAAPVALPAFLVTAAGYMAVAGAVVGTVSQLAVKGPKEENEDRW